MSRLQLTFGALVLAQSAHSVEEYVGRLWPVRREWPVAAYLAWIWVAMQVINGVGHPLWSLREGGYTPGVATAPVLLILALYLARQLRDAGRRPSAAA